MKESLKKKKLEDFRSYNTERILKSQFSPVPLHMKLISNPFLRDQQKFQYIIFRVQDYNRRVSSEKITDAYESMVFQKLHSIMHDLSYLETREDQLVRLQEIFDWFKGQEKLIEQRKDQGDVRYQTQRKMQSEKKSEEKSKSNKKVKEEIPYQVMEREKKPFKRKWRTTHKELDIPLNRLKEYKRKVINIIPFIDKKDQKKAPTIIYPKIQKMEEKEEEQEEEKAEEAEIKEGQQGEAKKEEEKEEEKEDPNQQNLGGFGQQPEEPEEEEREQAGGNDPLAPKRKNYTIEYQNFQRKKEVQNRAQKLYLKKQHQTLQLQGEDVVNIDYINERGREKSKIQKELQKRLETMKFQGKYCLSKEPPSYTERLNPSEERKFGLTIDDFSNRSKETVNLYLPKIKQETMPFNKTMRKERLHSLKNKYGKLLNLEENDEREPSTTICQHSTRKRNFSLLLANHSKSKERLHQLEDITKIKEKLTQTRITIEARSLSMGLCVPEEDDKCENFFPEKDLPSNPAMVDTKKKKKK